MTKISNGGKLAQQVSSETPEEVFTESQRKVELKQFKKLRQEIHQEGDIVSEINSLKKPRVYKGRVIYSGVLPPHRYKATGPVGPNGEGTYAYDLQQWGLQEEAAKERYLSTKSKLVSFARQKGLSKEAFDKANQFLSQDEQLGENLRVARSKEGLKKKSSSPNRFARRGSPEFRSQQDLLRDPRPTSQTFREAGHLQKQGLTQREAVDVVTGKKSLENLQTKLQDRTRRKAERDIAKNLRSQDVDVRSVDVRDDGSVKIAFREKTPKINLSRSQIVAVENQGKQEVPFTPAPKEYLEGLKNQPSENQNKKLEKTTKNLLSGPEDIDRLNNVLKNSYSRIPEEKRKGTTEKEYLKNMRDALLNFNTQELNSITLPSGEEIHLINKDKISGPITVQGLKNEIKDDYDKSPQSDKAPKKSNPKLKEAATDKPDMQANEIINAGPVLLCKSSDVANVSRRDQVRVSDVDYYINEIVDDGTGITALHISEN